MNRLFITGDTHGRFDKIEYLCRKENTSTDDICIILGDVGINFYLNDTDAIKKRRLAKLPITLFCVHGNHEERPYNISSYEICNFMGAEAYYETAYPNLIFAKDGEIYNINGKTMMSIGGAYSVDKFYRLSQGMAWFPSEQPDENIKHHVETNLTKSDWHIDYILSHTTPFSCEPTWAFIEGIDQSTVDNSTEKWLDAIHAKLSFSYWFAGHFHVDSVENDVHILFDSVIRLNTDMNKTYQIM